MKLLLAAALVLATSTPLYAAGDAEAGKGKSAACAACHGANGVSAAPIFPNLAGQKTDYLVAQLKAFKSGERKGASSAMMAPLAAGLSEQDMMDLAAFYNSLEAGK